MLMSLMKIIREEITHHALVPKGLEGPSAYAANCFNSPNTIIGNQNLFDRMITAAEIHKLFHRGEKWTFDV